MADEHGAPAAHSETTHTDIAHDMHRAPSHSSAPAHAEEPKSTGGLFGLFAPKKAEPAHAEADHEGHASLLKKYHFDEEEEEIEYHAHGMKTGFPAPIDRFKYQLIYETPAQNIEEHYYWILHNLRYDFGFTHFDKVTDIFAASEHSAFFGVSEQRLAAQQDRVSQFLRGISDMMKALFQIVREIRIIDERLTFYNDSYNRGPDAQGSEITLKGIWIDQVEGGVKNAGSVYGLSQTVGFTILPDLFFRLKIDDRGMDKLVGDWDRFTQKTMSFPKQIDEQVVNLDFNEKVKEVLKRKLTQYYIWKGRTYKELYTRKRFTVKYLRQHYDTIKLYMGWIKPYLRNVRKLRMDQRKMESWELVSAFEGSMLEVEVLLSRQLPEQQFHPCILLSFFFITRPAMQFVGEGYQRGPSHMGKMDMEMRGYVWSDNQIKNFKNMKLEEDFELLSTIDESLKEALDSLGDELKGYLMSEGEYFPDRPKAKLDEAQKIPGMLDPFISIFTGMKDVATGFGTLPDLIPKKKNEEKVDPEKAHYDTRVARAHVRRSMWLTWKNFKKEMKMLQW